MRIDYIRIPYANSGNFLAYCRKMQLVFSYVEDSNGDLLCLTGQSDLMVRAVEEAIEGCQAWEMWEEDAEAKAGFCLVTGG